MKYIVPDRIKNSLVHKFEIICAYCHRKPNEIIEYIEIAKCMGITPDMAVQQEEGTHNTKNGHFCCTDCYIKIGMPATGPGDAKGWVAP